VNVPADRAVRSGHFTAVSHAAKREATVNASRHRAVVRELYRAASLTFFRKACVNILWSRNTREGNLIACSVAILSIACVQNAGERRLVGKDYLVARSASGCRLTASDCARDLNIIQIHFVGGSACGSAAAVNVPADLAVFSVHFTAVSHAVRREAAVNASRHRAVVRELYRAASLTFFRKASVNILGGSNIGKGNFVACSVAISGIASKQIAGEFRPVGKGYLVARSVSGSRIASSDTASDLNITQVYSVGRSACISIPAVNVPANSAVRSGYGI